MAGGRISRRKLATFLADKLTSGELSEKALSQVAAYLVETRQTHDAELLIRSTEEELMKRGVVVATVEAARPISSDIKAAISRMFNAKELHMREKVDPSLLGGIRVDAPGKR